MGLDSGVTFRMEDTGGTTMLQGGGEYGFPSRGDNDSDKNILKLQTDEK